MGRNIFQSDDRAAGVAVTTRRYPGLVHGSFEMCAVVPAAQELLQDVAGTRAEALAR